MGQTVNLLSFDFGGSNPPLPTPTPHSEGPENISESSSVGRASAFQAEGRGFEPRLSLISQCSSVGRAHPW